MKKWICLSICLVFSAILAGYGLAANLGAAASNAPLPAGNIDATATPTASKIPIADESGKLDGWISLAGIGAEPTQTAASQAEMEAGTEAGIRSVSPLRVAQAIAALAASSNHVRVDKTEDYSVLAADLTGMKTFTNQGAAGAVNLTLPAGATNYRCRFMLAEAQYLRVTANGTEKFRYGAVQGAAGGYVRSNTLGTVWEITWSGDDWVIAPLSGTLLYDE